MASIKNIKGCITLMPTPFFENDEIDFEEFRKQIVYLENVGMHGIVVASSAGEGYTLNKQEFQELARTARDTCNRMICVINCSYQNTTETIERVQYAEAIGADCAMVYPYHYMQKYMSLYEYFKIINESTSEISIMLLNDKRETKGWEISFDLYKRLLIDFPRIVATVEDVENSSEIAFPNVSEIFAAFGERVSIFARSEAGMFSAMSITGRGALATYGLAMPKLLLGLYDSCYSKNWTGALDHHRRLTRYPLASNAVGVNFQGYPSDLFPGTFVTSIGYTHVIANMKYGTVFPGTPVNCKALADAAGWRVGKLRLPMLSASEGMRKFAREWLLDINS